MIEEVNKILRDIGSNFRTNDGVSICMYSGHLMFLKKHLKVRMSCSHS